MKGFSGEWSEVLDILTVNAHNRNTAFKINKNSSNQVIEVVAPSGKGVAIKYGSEALWIQIHTADRDGGENSREALAVEPMTCPPDAFNSGIDLIVLKPGESHCATWYIEEIE